MAGIVAGELVDALEAAGFVIMREPPRRLASPDGRLRAQVNSRCEAWCSYDRAAWSSAQLCRDRGDVTSRERAPSNSLTRGLQVDGLKGGHHCYNRYFL
jgi:hypothetical protein